MIRWLLLLAAAGCAGASDDAPIDDVAPVVAQPVAEWLPAGHPAAAAQARWGLPIPCEGLRVVELDPSELQAACNSPEQLEERSAGTLTFGCASRLTCEIQIAAGMSASRRAFVMAHEVGHLLGARHVEDCPPSAPGAHLMCAHGPVSRSPWPTVADFDMVVR